MPIASASSGIVIPGRSRTSLRASWARVPEPRGGPRGPVGGAAGAGGAPGGGVGGAGGPARAAGRRGPRGGSGADAGECALGGLETVELVDERAQFLESRLDLLALLVEEVRHRRSPG